MPPQKPLKLSLTPEELERVARAKQRNESTKVSEEWLFIAEFGIYFGWAGVEALMNDDTLTLDTANMLIAGARKVKLGYTYDQATATFYGTLSAKSKRPNVTFKKLTKDMLSKAKADT